jgi:regulator of sigma E protease
VSQILSSGWPWALTIAGFAFLIIIHEFGHFIAAKATGMRVERFFLFFPPKIVSIKRGETEYGIGMLPFGGFVKITGMNPDELKAAPAADDEESKPGGGLMTKVEGAGQGRPTEPLPPDVLKRAYYNQPVWKRIVVIGAGPAANLLLAFVLLFAVSLSLNEFDGQVGAVETGTPAAAHLATGDKLLAVDGKSYPNLDQQARATHFINLVSKHKCAAQPPTDGCRAKQPVDLKIQRNGQVQHLLVTPFYDVQAKRMRLGFSYGTKSVAQSPPAAAGHAASEMWRVTTGTLGVFSKIFEPQERKKIHGIVGISDVTQQAVQYGVVEALTLIAFISLSLAIINLFPFLPLDGGHIFWSLVEKVRGRPVPFSIMERASVVGFLLVMVLFAIGLSNDIHALNNGGLNIR